MVGDRSEPTLSLAERNMRLRAHDDPETIDKAHRFVVTFFGGDHRRAAWFFDELAAVVETGGSRPKTFFSVKTKTHKSIHLRK